MQSALKLLTLAHNPNLTVCVGLAESGQRTALMGRTEFAFHTEVSASKHMS